MSPDTHEYLHFTRKAQFLQGGALGSFDSDGSGDDDSAAQFNISAGFFVDEDLLTGPNSVATNESVFVYYLEGSEGNLRRSTNTVPWGKILNNPSGRAYYNENIGGVWQLSEVANNDYVHYFYVWINGVDGKSPQVGAYMGQVDYLTVSEARNGLGDEVNAVVQRIPQQETVLLGAVLFQTSDSYNNGVKARVRTNVDGDDYADYRGVRIEPGQGVADHQSLSGIQGGFPWYHSNQPIDSSDSVTFNAITSSTDVVAEQLTSTDDATIAGNLQSSTIQNGAQLVDTNLQGTSVAIIQNVEKFGTQDGSDFVRTIDSSGSIQSGYWADGQLLMDNAYGCIQSVVGSAGGADRGFVIGDGANLIYGAMQLGRSSILFSTNNASASLQIFYGDASESAYLPYGVEEALTIGANTATNDRVIVVGNNMTSHGDGSVSAKSVWTEGDVSIGSSFFFDASTGKMHLGADTNAPSIQPLGTTNMLFTFSQTNLIFDI